jgi:sugar transferase (PEP-CTERM/EpsH1 system associated)
MPTPDRPNLLFLAHRVPYPPDKGDRIRTYHLLRFLSRRAAVHLACLADEPVAEPCLAALNRLCARVAVVPAGGRARWLRGLLSLACGRTASEGVFSSSALRSVVRGWAADTRFQVALASASSLAQYLELPELAGVPAVVDLVDVDSQKWLDYAGAGRGPKAWLHALEGRRLRRLERALASRARALTLVSAAEAELYRTVCGAGPVHAINNGVDLDYFTVAPQAAEPRCVFVGALDYRPNVDGAQWFCREVWPEIHRRRPEARVALVGRKPAPAVCRLAEIPGVELVGQVPDVRPHLAGAAVAVVPLRIARGLQNKVLEALATGRATVASPQALEGLAVRPGQHVLSASQPHEWVDAVLALFADAARRRQLGEAGRAFVEDCHRWDRCLTPFGSILGLPEPTDASTSAA